MSASLEWGSCQPETENLGFCCTCLPIYSMSWQRKAPLSLPPSFSGSGLLVCCRNKEKSGLWGAASRAVSLAAVCGSVGMWFWSCAVSHTS